MTFIDFILYANLLTLLAYAIGCSYLDIKYREVNPLYWIGLLAICGPITVYMYLTDYWYPWYSLAFSLVMCVIFWAMFRYRIIEGADYLFLCFISLFWVMSPYPTAHGLMQPVFYIYLMFTWMMTGVVVWGYNVFKGSDLGLIGMIGKYPRGVPMIVPIAAAFILSVVFG